MFVLFNFIIGIVLSIVDNLAGSTYTYYTSAAGIPLKMGYIDTIYNMLVLLPNLAVGVRRLHDVNKSGKLILLVFAPLALFLWAAVSGAYMLLLAMLLVLLGMCIWLIVLYCIEGTRGPNKYGEDPYGNGGFKFSFEEDAPVEE